MTKELEAFNEIIDKFAEQMIRANKEELTAINKTNAIEYLYRTPQVRLLQQSLLRLEAIDNAKSSEALECLERLARFVNPSSEDGYRLDQYEEDYNCIQQALIKSQEQEKENAYIEKIKTMMKQRDCVLRYIESEDCFAVKTILSDGWYKLTHEFIENNVREEIKPLPLVEKNKQLKPDKTE